MRRTRALGSTKGVKKGSEDNASTREDNVSTKGAKKGSEENAGTREHKGSEERE